MGHSPLSCFLLFSLFVKHNLFPAEHRSTSLPITLFTTVPSSNVPDHIQLWKATLKLTIGAYAIFQVKKSKVQIYCSGRSRVEISVLVARSQYGIRNWVNHHMTAFDVFTSHQFTANWSVFMAMLGFHWAGP